MRHLSARDGRRGRPAVCLPGGGTLVLLLVFFGGIANAEARTLRLFVVGNSFSNNATRFLPELAKAGGHELIMGKAQTGGCSFERHWNAVAAFRANPGDPKGRIYGGKSLHELMGGGPWDVITVQQYSLHSSDVGTYEPFASNLVAHLQGLQPGAEIVIHQTWAYRSDAAKFGQIGGGQNAADAREMWERSRAAYWRLAQSLPARVIPTGDAFWRVASDPQWAYRPDSAFDSKTASYPTLPQQMNSLHVGYRWNAKKEFGLDANHANVAGEYLGALVWYGFLFDESPEKLVFVPPGVEAAFAVQLRRVAWQVVQEVAPQNSVVLANHRARPPR